MYTCYEGNERGRSGGDEKIWKEKAEGEVKKKEEEDE